MKPNEIQQLNDPSFALSIYDKVFSARTGYEIVFQPRIAKRGIIFPIFYILTGEYLDAFVAAVSTIGEDSFYLSMTERTEASYTPKKGYEKEFGQSIREDKSIMENPYADRNPILVHDWFCPLNEISTFLLREKYLKDFHILDNAIYSVNGTWGLWFCNDGYAIIGGSDEFITTFYGGIHKTNEEMAVHFIKGTQNTQYATKYLQRLFGEEEAERYIKVYKESL